MQPYNTEQINRLGLHYYPDTVHYRMEDLKLWMPWFKKMKLGWLVLRSEGDRAIPEFFLRSLLQENISPIIQFDFSYAQPINQKDLRILLQVYARWGIRYISFFDRPNQKDLWPATGWTQKDLVERFLDIFVPLARTAIDEGLIPLFPALEPGGSYWDTAFLRGSLQGLLRRKQELVLKNLVLSAYAHTFNKGLNWGAGGPERWPQTKPYLTPKDSQDQCGFRIFEWYQKISNAILEKNLPIILFQAGLPSFPEKDSPGDEEKPKVWRDQRNIIRLLNRNFSRGKFINPKLDDIPNYILSCNFWVLAQDDVTGDTSFSWFQNEAPVSQCVDLMVALAKEDQEDSSPKLTQEKSTKSKSPIQHYVLLPVYEWGIADWHLEVISPFIKKYKPTIGFSPEEAKFAQKVTVIGNPQSIPEEILEDIRQSGSIVERISGDGTSIATQLAER